MKVFLSWSGEKSHKVALVLKEWLPSVIQSLEPYVSSEDIDKGARWTTDIAKELDDSGFGILCVTKENLNAPWLTFEAGALSKKFDKSYVSPFLFDIKRSEVEGPILQFQSTIRKKEDILKLVKTLNKSCGSSGLDDKRLEKTFETWFPILDKELKKTDQIFRTAGTKTTEQKNPDQEILEELLDLARKNHGMLSQETTLENEELLSELWAQTMYLNQTEYKMKLRKSINKLRKSIESLYKTFSVHIKRGKNKEMDKAIDAVFFDFLDLSRSFRSFSRDNREKSPIAAPVFEVATDPEL